MCGCVCVCVEVVKVEHQDICDQYLLLLGQGQLSALASGVYSNPICKILHACKYTHGRVT